MMVHQIFNKSFDHIEEIADSGTSYNQQGENNFGKDLNLTRNLKLHSFSPICFTSLDRDKLLEESSFNSTYDPDSKQAKVDSDIEEDKKDSYKSGKGIIKFFGYKHKKSMHVFA